MAITLEEARKLKKGDAVSIRGKVYTVTEKPVDVYPRKTVRVALTNDEVGDTYFNEYHLGLVDLAGDEEPAKPKKEKKPKTVVIEGLEGGDPNATVPSVPSVDDGEPPADLTKLSEEISA